MLFKSPAQMEFIIKSKVDGSLMESSLRLVRQEMPSHFQSGLHLVSVERFLAGFPEAVVQGAGTDKMRLRHFPGSVKKSEDLTGSACILPLPAGQRAACPRKLYAVLRFHTKAG